MYRRSPVRAVTVVLLSVAALTGVTACGGNTTAPAPGTVLVEATDTACTVRPATASTGRITFHVTNKGTKTTEFYLYGPGDKVISEVEGIGVGLTRDMTVEANRPGTYTTACKPGMKGAGIRGKFTITAK